MAVGLALIFPGQGSQSVGMLAELATAHGQVRAAFDEASAGCGVDLWALSQSGPEADLNQTEFTQPALLAAGVAVWRVWQALGGPRPRFLAGHSLGEYTALVAAGALSLADGAKLVRARGQYMQAAVPAGQGAMAAVLNADDALIAEVCSGIAAPEVAVPANFNSPGQTVIGGSAAGVDAAIAALAERGVRKAVKLAVSVPSHTPLMREAAEQLRGAMTALNWALPSIPVLQNADARAHDTLDSIQDALVRQLYNPVRWTECVQRLAAAGVTALGECGPGKVLCGLAKRIDKNLDARALGGSAELNAAINDWSAA